MKRDDGALHGYLEDKQPLPRPPPAQILGIGDPDSSKIKVVFVSTGRNVPWSVTFVDCPARYLLRHKQNVPAGATTVPVIREDGDFRVEWDDD